MNISYLTNTSYVRNYTIQSSQRTQTKNPSYPPNSYGLYFGAKLKKDVPPIQPDDNKQIIKDELVPLEPEEAIITGSGDVSKDSSDLLSELNKRTSTSGIGNRAIFDSSGHVTRSSARDIKEQIEKNRNLSASEKRDLIKKTESSMGWGKKADNDGLEHNDDIKPDENTDTEHEKHDIENKMDDIDDSGIKDNSIFYDNRSDKEKIENKIINDPTLSAREKKEILGEIETSMGWGKNADNENGTGTLENTHIETDDTSANDVDCDTDFADGDDGSVDDFSCLD